jgi:hypothetical protein
MNRDRPGRLLQAAATDWGSARSWPSLRLGATESLRGAVRRPGGGRAATRRPQAAALLTASTQGFRMRAPEGWLRLQPRTPPLTLRRAARSVGRGVSAPAPTWPEGPKEGSRRPRRGVGRHAGQCGTPGHSSGRAGQPLRLLPGQRGLPPRAARRADRLRSGPPDHPALRHRERAVVLGAAARSAGPGTRLRRPGRPAPGRASRVVCLSVR